jgi:sialidase-1
MRAACFAMVVDLLVAQATLAAAAEGPAFIDVFKAGTEGYHSYRIPSVIVTSKGTVLAFCEGRKKSRSDAGDIDLVLKRSLDGGKSWQPMQVVWDDGPHTCGNPCPVVDRTTGTIWLLLTHNLGQDTEAKLVDGKSEGTRTVWVSQSTDDGVTWSKPVEITKDVKRPDWTWYATGPGIGIQTRFGRLVIPCDNKVAVTRPSSQSSSSTKVDTSKSTSSGSSNKPPTAARQSHVIYSDDHGKTWKLGGVVGPNCNESQVVELTDGSLLLNMRSYEANHRRLIATSRDGGVTWSAPKEDPALIEPVCQASIIRVPGDAPRLLFSNPASTKREKLTLKLSLDEGRTWPVARELHPGPAAYSCLTVLPDQRLACLYECGDKSAYDVIRLATFSQSWLTAPK